MHGLRLIAAGAVLAAMAGCETKVITPPAQHTTVIREQQQPREIIRERPVAVPTDKPAVQNNISVEK